MKFSRTIPFLTICVCLCAAAIGADEPVKKADEPVKKTDEPVKKKSHGPGLLDKLIGTFHHGKDGKDSTPAGTERKVGAGRLSLTMSVDPQPLKLTEARQMKVTMRVANKTKKMVQLEFPTTQRIEVLVKNSVGKLVEQWSEDHTFANEPGMVSINPNEHLEYSVTVATRDMAAGETYMVEALFPNYESLRMQKSVVPEK